ncbi:hypothetical protein KZ483_27640 [Paenibacillus sp. sptzw28]|uniref:hypothetical protein n=1 Tax=Paenibacillus sp. sptzw28 TaxID=715179 RepID=UPI001C6DF9D8|nr:hypothetical protein [Paenibacillus sp. sptzw28]QYR21398.1 hypothetical protein KZ483_27640 [Paenibacillus sp. sptzw28]
MLEQYHKHLFHAASQKFGILNIDPQETHFSEHSLVGSYELGGGRVFLRITISSHKQYEKVLGEVHLDTIRSLQVL